MERLLHAVHKLYFDPIASCTFESNFIYLARDTGRWLSVVVYFVLAKASFQSGLLVISQ